MLYLFIYIFFWRIVEVQISFISYAKVNIEAKGDLKCENVIFCLFVLF